MNSKRNAYLVKTKFEIVNLLYNLLLIWTSDKGERSCHISRYHLTKKC